LDDGTVEEVASEVATFRGTWPAAFDGSTDSVSDSDFSASRVGDGAVSTDFLNRTLRFGIGDFSGDGLGEEIGEGAASPSGDF